MIRNDIISTLGRDYLQTNIENGEFSYPQAFRDNGIEYTPIYDSNNKEYKYVDIRLVYEKVTVLIETKRNFKKKDEKQLEAYVKYEKQLTRNNIVAILANTYNDKIKVWKNEISDETLLEHEEILKTIEEYAEIFNQKTNNKEKVMKNTYELNEMLHKFGISEKLRSQFVGTCLLALKNDLNYKIIDITTSQINIKIKEILGNLLTNDINKAEKIAILSSRILENQEIRDLKASDFKKILNYIESNILPFINDKSTAGQDLLNLFFVTFNKYVGKADKNQAFTPDHITDFMSKICSVNRHSIVLDPCCGSGSFLVRAMTQAFQDCRSEREKEEIKKHHIFGIEYDDNVYGLATTNMLIHSDGNSNIKKGSCFELKNWIKESRPTVILMNPPYNAQRKHVPEPFSRTWADKTKEDPTKGFYFVKYIADTLNEANLRAKMAVLLPVACAIGNSEDIKEIKKSILQENTLDAVFTLPAEVFYPGASASVCCMVFEIGKKHNDLTNPKTFFGYYKNDNFKKKKNIGRVEQIDSITGESLWKKTENLWIDLYRKREERDGLSSLHKVNGDDEWLCEAYMKTDYSLLKQSDFEETIREYLAYKIGSGRLKDGE